MKCLFQYILAATIAPIAFAQVEDLVFNSTVPEDLKVDLDANSPDFYVSFEGNAEEDRILSSAGKDSSEVASPPDFYVSDIPITGDRINLLVGMIRTTLDESRSLHWLISETRTNSQNDQEPESSSRETLLQYQAPGTNGEEGIQQYIFVLWTAGPDITIGGLPEDQIVKDFDVEQFEQENNLEGPLRVSELEIVIEDESEQEVDEVVEIESSSDEEIVDETIDNNISSDVDDTDAAAAFNRVSRLIPVIIYSGIIGAVLM